MLAIQQRCSRPGGGWFACSNFSRSVNREGKWITDSEEWTMVVEFKILDFGVSIPHSRNRPCLRAGLCIAALPNRRASDPSAITQAETRTVVRVSCKRRKDKGEGRK